MNDVHSELLVGDSHPHKYLWGVVAAATATDADKSQQLTTV